MVEKKKTRKTKPPLRLVKKPKLRNATEVEAISAIVSVYLDELENAGVSFAAAARDPFLEVHLEEGTKVPESLAREIEAGGHDLTREAWSTANDYLNSVVHEAVVETVSNWLSERRCAKRVG